MSANSSDNKTQQPAVRSTGLRIRTITGRIIQLFTMLLIILFSLIFFFTGTERGVNLLLTGLQEAIDQQFEFSGLQGNLLTQITLRDLHYQDRNIKLAVKALHLDWQIYELLNKTISIKQITASGIRLTQLSLSKENITEPLSADKKTIALPQINLPIAINLQQLQLSDIQLLLLSETAGQLQTKSQTKWHTEQIEQLSLRASLHDSQLTLQQVQLTSQQYHALTFSLQGVVDLKGNYPLTLQSEIELRPELTNTSLALTEQAINLSSKIQGDLSQLQLKQNISGLFDAQIDFQASDLLQKIHWTGKVQLSRLPLNLLNAENYPQLADKILSAEIQSSGDLAQAQSTITSRLADNSGTLKLNSSISWANGIHWQANLLTDNINPGLLHPDWPGILSIDLYSDGSFVSEQLVTQIKLKQLRGQLRQQPLNGSGQFQLNNTRLAIQHLSLSSGSAQLMADGQLDNSSPNSHLNWSVNIKQLADLLPHAQGAIKAKGNISGSFNDTLALHQQQLTLVANIKADNIVYQTTQLQHAEIQLQLQSNPAKHSQLQFNAQSLLLDTQAIKQVTVNIDGPLKQHQIQLNIDHDQASLNLQAQGQFDTQKISWSGQIQQLQLSSQLLGLWQQETPAKFTASTDKISLSTLCIKEHTEIAQGARLCSEVNWVPEQGAARLQLNKLSFMHLKPYLPEEISQFSGALNILADITLAPQLLAQIKADILPGELVFQTFAKAPISLPHRNGHITAEYDSAQLTALWHINMGPHSLDGDINIPRKALENNPAHAAIKGKLKLDVSNLELLSILVPQISELKGQFMAEMQLGGTLDAPAVTGQADFTADYLAIRDTGTRIENIRLSIMEKNAGQALAIQGELHSGAGQLDIDGLFKLNAAQGWPLTLNIKGRDFLAINLPEIYALISPDIQFSQSKGLMHIKGGIFIPEATISAHTIPEGSVSASPDVEILGMEKAAPANIDLDISLDLGQAGNKLNNNAGVKVDAFGLKSQLSGKITLQQQPGQLITAHGQLHLINGTFRAYGQDLNIDQGNIFYAGGYLDNPGIKLTASRQLAETKVGIKVAGSARKPRINTFSDDSSLDSKDIISMLLTGQKVDNLENARVYAGTEISDGLSVGVNAGAGDEGSEFITRYKLTDKIQLEGSSSASKSGGSIIYTFEVE